VAQGLGQKLLPHGRGVDEAQDAVGQNHTRPPAVSPSRHGRVHSHVAHPLPGQGQVLGKGADHHAVLVDAGKIAGHFSPVIGQETVRLVRDEQKMGRPVRAEA
jgi:hypothetical protein